jgi:hypothetical protein
MTNQSVIKSWVSGRAAGGGNLFTNGKELYSYALLIGTGSGATIFDHTSGGGSYYSQTTSCHVGLAKRLAPHAEILAP